MSTEANNAGVQMAKDGNLYGAIEKYEEALRLDSSNRVARRNVAVARAKLAWDKWDWEEAEKHLAEAAQYSPDDTQLAEWHQAAKKKAGEWREYQASQEKEKARAEAARPSMDRVLANLSADLNSSRRSAGSATTTAANAPTSLDFAAPTPGVTGDRLASRQLPSAFYHGQEAAKAARSEGEAGAVAARIEAAKVFEKESPATPAGEVRAFERGSGPGAVDPIVPPDKRTSRIASWEETRRKAREELQQATRELQELKNLPSSPARDVEIAKREQQISTKRSEIAAANLNISQELIDLGVNVNFAPEAGSRSIQSSTGLDFQAPPAPK